MKKIIIVIAALTIGIGASAQSIGDLIKGAAKAAGVDEKTTNAVVNTVTAVTGTSLGVSLPGTWTYKGPAFDLEGESTLATVASAAAGDKIKSTVSSYLEKVGLKPGAVTFTFNNDNSFTCTISKIPLNGTYTLDSEGNISMKYGKSLKYFSMTGKVKGTLDGCEMLFNADKFLDFVKTAMSYVNKISKKSSSVSSLSGNYSGMKLGFDLEKK